MMLGRIRGYSAFALAITSLLVSGACVAPDEEEDLSEEDVVSSPRAGGILPDSFEETAVLNLVNDTALDANAFRTRVKISSTVANAIVQRRISGPTTFVFTSIAQIDALPSTGTATFRALRVFAMANGYDFSPPNRAELTIPENLGRPPTSQDVTVVRGFDGRTPDEALALVRKKLSTTLHPQNENLVRTTILATHKAFTIGLGNFFVAGSPPERFLLAQPAGATFTLLGTMSQINPTVLLVEVGGQKSYFKRTSGGYERLDASYLNANGELRYFVVMASRIRLSPQGVRLVYPAWAAPGLSTPASSISEGGP